MSILNFPSKAQVLLVLAIILSNAVAFVIPRHATVATRQTVSNSTYDFIIVGAGVAGLTVADRLTEDPSISVLVIEAGPFDSGEDSVLIPGSWNPGPYLWPGLSGTPQQFLNNRIISAPCGRVVGGGSAVNAMFLLRGSTEDYDGWVELGAQGWGWNDLLPYFKKSETFTPPDQTFADAHNISWDNSVHGFNGPVQANYPPYDFAPTGNWWSAALSTGIRPIKDPNDGESAGVYWSPRLMDSTMKRNYARINHYERVKTSRPNYEILAEHIVGKVLFHGTRAMGVEYLATEGGPVLVAHASKEVLMAAGGAHTPQILQLSGIGPQDLLDEFDIEVVSDLPGVGSNFQDQSAMYVPNSFTSNLAPNSGELDTNPMYDAQQRALYDSSRQGAYTIVRGTGNAIASIPLRNASSSYQDIVSAAEDLDAETLLPSGTDSTVVAGYEAQREILLRQLSGYKTPMGMIHWSTGPITFLYMLKPLSRGTVKISSADPLENPRIDWRTAADPTDMELSLALFRKHREVMAAPDMDALGPEEQAPFGAHLQTDEELKEMFRDSINPSNAHECCTAPMMPKNMGGVVNNENKVYGVQGLRVIDASFWPTVVTGAPSATVYGGGEKIADMIKQEYGIS
ncbi:GMC oxidoreductase [Patellaria atrata CBS 101060]|uniref:GMC oxidoreductase n=1 Tax=Patellaria atrata CBS 101060 TaxID=1346257 RepID=A0A9P4SJN2_9PEZI|nr:GMC oxidoreductase [Patellaria atrata CBS 101060]